MSLIYLRSCSHIKASMVLKRDDPLFNICINTQLYKINSTYYINNYFNGPDEARTSDLLLVCLTS